MQRKIDNSRDRNIPVGFLSLFAAFFLELWNEKNVKYVLPLCNHITWEGMEKKKSDKFVVARFSFCRITLVATQPSLAQPPRIIRITLLRHFVAVRFLGWLCFFLDGFPIFTQPTHSPTPPKKKRQHYVGCLNHCIIEPTYIYIALIFPFSRASLSAIFSSLVPRLYYFNRIGIGNWVNLIYFTRRKPTENRVTPRASCR